MAAADDLVRYDGKHVVVTGCASGIGAHAARRLADLGEVTCLLAALLALPALALASRRLFPWAATG